MLSRQRLLFNQDVSWTLELRLRASSCLLREVRLGFSQDEIYS